MTRWTGVQWRFRSWMGHENDSTPSDRQTWTESCRCVSMCVCLHTASTATQPPSSQVLELSHVTAGQAAMPSSAVPQEPPAYLAQRVGQGWRRWR
jgi:hypothetical protein